VTADANPQLLLLFTEPVVGLQVGSFNVQLQPVAAQGDSAPAEVRTLQPAAGADSAGSATGFTLQLALPPAYTGGVNITLQVRARCHIAML
jgi:hypothetical protein